MTQTDFDAKLINEPSGNAIALGSLFATMAEFFAPRAKTNTTAKAAQRSKFAPHEKAYLCDIGMAVDY